MNLKYDNAHAMREDAITEYRLKYLRMNVIEDYSRKSTHKIFFKRYIAQF